MQLVSAAEAATRRYFMNLPNGIGNWVSSYMGVTAAEARARQRAGEAAAKFDGPVAYLVEQPAESTVAGHYHQVDQFQVFVATDGRFGSTPLHGLHLHYAAAFTPYAPISAGREVLKYFTLRPGFDPGAQWMPESKDRLLSRKRAFRAETAAIGLGPQAPGVASTTALVDPDASGVGAWCYEMGAGARVRTVEPDEGGGQFLVGLSGDCNVDGVRLARYDIAHLAPDDAAREIAAGPEGAAVLLVRFARPRPALLDG